ncbi:hypothetical protein [Enterocloster asparagiformis]|uniref:hypothetical protein n=1 Tax=Enterocloster asparagiformis TaxID=333367 RepID=UPI0004649C7F|nr:hypothetical protein [Enterocloster asparagiformis]
MKLDSPSRIILGADEEGKEIILVNYEVVLEESDLIEDYIRHTQRVKIVFIRIGCVLIVLLAFIAMAFYLEAI